MSQILIYDKAMCCNTGVCGPSVDPVLPRFAADLDWLQQQGHNVLRYNLAQDPAEFAASETVQKLLQEEGVECLPVVLVDESIVSRSRYPSREEFASWTGTQIKTGLSLPVVDQDCCSGESGCC